jgi:hypothetical protein
MLSVNFELSHEVVHKTKSPLPIFARCQHLFHVEETLRAIQGISDAQSINRNKGLGRKCACVCVCGSNSTLWPACDLECSCKSKKTNSKNSMRVWGTLAHDSSP